jgi:hypothetical protein
MRRPFKLSWTLVVLVLALALVAAVVGIPKSPLRGWLEIIGFGTMGLVYILGRLAGSRRQHWAFGTYMLVAGCDFGLAQVWPGEPAWLLTAMQVAFFVSVIWFLIEVSRSFKRTALSS